MLLRIHPNPRLVSQIQESQIQERRVRTVRGLADRPGGRSREGTSPVLAVGPLLLSEGVKISRAVAERTKCWLEHPSG